MKTHEINNVKINLQYGVTLFPEQDKAIDKILADLIQKIPAQFILMTNVTGQIISVCGERGKTDLIALGSLVAGELVANQEIARISGEYQEYQLILRQGSTTNTWIAEAGDYLVLLLKVSSDVPMGWARMLITQGAKAIAKIMRETPQQEKPTEFSLGDGFSNQIDDALEDLWNE